MSLSIELQVRLASALRGAGGSVVDGAENGALGVVEGHARKLMVQHPISRVLRARAPPASAACAERWKQATDRRSRIEVVLGGVALLLLVGKGGVVQVLRRLLGGGLGNVASAASCVIWPWPLGLPRLVP